MKLNGTVALVTGAAGGLGRATAAALISGGCQVGLVDLPDTDGESVARGLGTEATFIPADVRSEEQLSEVLQVLSARFAIPRIIVNAAGVGPASRTLTDASVHPLELFRQTLEVNLVGTFNVARLGAELMRQVEPLDGERGVIVNTASVAAFDGQIGQVAYAASKAGVVGMTLPLARDLGRYGIRVVTVAPGAFATPMFASLPEDVRERIVGGMAFPRRLGDPAEFATAVCSIVGNPMWNGESVRLDGGLRLGRA